MIERFSELKKDLVELAAVLNQFKSEAVQVRLLELLFDSPARGGGEERNDPFFDKRLLEMLISVQRDLQGLLDLENEMSEMTSMRLQMSMDRRSKFVEALSNIMKKIDSTQETIVQNLKG